MQKSVKTSDDSLTNAEEMADEADELGGRVSDGRCDDEELTFDGSVGDELVLIQI